MTDKQDLIREIHEYVTTHGGENTATHLLVQAASAIQTQGAELEAVGAGGVQALSAAPAGFVPLAAFDRLHAHAESLAARLLAAEQAAPKAAQEEMDKEASNARLDIDSNSTEPEQQRDVACSLEVGQHVGNGEHQEASCRGSKDSELLKIAARNLKYFIEHAQFSSFADKRAALNCLDALAAPQQEAQEPSHRETVDVVGVRSNSEHVNLGKIAMPPRMKAREIAIEQFGSFKDDDGSDAEMCFGALEYFLEWLIQQGWSKAPQPAPAPLSDDVVKDAARYRWLRATTNFATNSQGERIDVRNQPEKWDAAIDAALAAQGGK